MVWANRCTCASPTWDEPHIGLCDFCERQEHDARFGERDEDYEAMLDGSAALSGEALAAMGEADDSLMLGGSGGGERDPVLEWF